VVKPKKPEKGGERDSRLAEKKNSRFLATKCKCDQETDPFTKGHTPEKKDKEKGWQGEIPCCSGWGRGNPGGKKEKCEKEKKDVFKKKNCCADPIKFGEGVRKKG